MNVLININKQFIKPAIVMLSSLSINNPGKHVIYVAHNDLCLEDFNYIRDNLAEFDCSIKELRVIVDFLSNNNIKIDSRWPETVYYRLFAPFEVEDDVDRLLYLDSDMIINDSIMELYNLHFGDALVACCDDSICNDFEENSKRLDLPLYHIYVNSGLILFNVKNIKKELRKDDVINCIISNLEKIKYPDQDILNILFVGKIVYLNFRFFNFICSRRRYTRRQYRDYQKKAIIYHFGGGNAHKPWNTIYIGNYADMFWRYAKKSIYIDEYDCFKSKNKFKKYFYRIIETVTEYWVKIEGKINK